MGVIRIDVAGSFKPNAQRSFGAQESGHAAAVAKAIAYLADEVLPAAIRSDHALQAGEHYPDDRFGLVDPTTS